MSQDIFNAAEWIYVADPMGRLGQGYYKNKSNSEQRLSPAEFERKRRASTEIQIKNKEHNINNNSILPQVSSQADSTRLQSSGQNDAQLSPWDNPIIGEQSVTEENKALQSDKIQTTSGQSEEQKRTERIEAEKLKKKQEEEARAQAQASGGESGGNDATGGLDGPGSDSKVVCSELVQQGLMTDRDRKACTIYAYKLPETFMRGYHFWAVPYVRLMRRSGMATRLIIPFVACRTREVRYRLKLEKKGSWAGKIICALHDRFCCLVGRWVGPVDYAELYRSAGK